MRTRISTLGWWLLCATSACSADGAGGRPAASRIDGANAGTGGGGGAGSGGGGGIAGSVAQGGRGGGGAQDGGVTAPSLDPISIDDCGAANPAGLADADVAKLMAGSGDSGGLRILYPYDGTVFPRGLIAPTLMWEGADDAQAVYVHVQSSTFEYKGCLTPTGPGQLLLPAEVWSKAEEHALGARDPLRVELGVLAGGLARGPVGEQLIVAQATLKGSIFYNSYESKLSPGQGGVLRIVPGKEAELFIGGADGGCNGCHAVSANGERLITSVHSGDERADAYAVMPGTAPFPPVLHTNPYDCFVGLSPDGAVYATNSSALFCGEGALLYETDTGTPIQGAGLPAGVTMPSFSPGGTLLAFNDRAINQSHGLALMDYDSAARSASGYRKIYEHPGEFPAWPFVLPDDNAVVFQLGETSRMNFTGGGAGIGTDLSALALPFPIPGFTGADPKGNLHILDLKSGTATLLARAMGFATPADAATGTTYLPFPDEDPNHTYYPTVSPVAAGGYFWVFFDSLRHYGNQGLHRQLWGTALTISADGSYVGDPSHPAFYLTGQEFGTGNHRAFISLDPCRDDGADCTSGVDCCAGFCTDGVCKTPDAPRCAHVDETCQTAADCCDESNVCIAGRCGVLVVE
jgi:hypothetical protein